jgi:hypothetical protein
MKNLIYFSVLAMLTVSCKKPYTCECVTTTTLPSSFTGGDPYTFVNRSENIEYSEKMKEKQAKAACEHEQQTISTIMYNGWNENGTAPSGIYSSTTCELD